MIISLPLFAISLSSSAFAAPATASSAPPAAQVMWSDPARYRSFSEAVRTKMERAGIEPVLINRAMSYLGDGSAIPPLVRDDRTALRRLLERPSIRLQMHWRLEAARIADELRTEFPITPGWKRNAHSDALVWYEPGEVNPDVDLVIDRSVGRLSFRPDDIFGQSANVAGDLARFVSFAPRQSAPLSLPLRRTRPIRVASTGSLRLDTRFRESLGRIRARLPDALIDDASFTASPIGEANFLVFRSSGGERTLLHNLLDRLYASRPDSLRDLATPAPKTVRSQGTSGSLALLDRLYLPSPSDLPTPYPSVVEANSDGGIDVAACLFNDDRSRDGSPEAVIEADVDICLLGALGAYATMTYGLAVDEVRSAMYESASRIYAAD